MRTAIVIFPGSNCDRDLEIALHRAVGRPPVRIWHAESELPSGTDLVAVPGGFSFGDYLRSGAIAARSPAMRAVQEFATRGGLVLGLCNGFQILAEIGLLPGAFLRNASLKFICRDVWLRVESTDSPFTRGYQPAQVLRIPISHADGAYTLPADGLHALTEEGRIAFRYVASPEGTGNHAANPNGSVGDIAGIFSPDRRVLGMMPHPERAVDPVLGNTDGAALFAALAGARG